MTMVVMRSTGVPMRVAAGNLLPPAAVLEHTTSTRVTIPSSAMPDPDKTGKSATPAGYRNEANDGRISKSATSSTPPTAFTLASVAPVSRLVSRLRGQSPG
jgi:hypothetical protein